MSYQEIARVLDRRGFLFLTVPFLWPLHHVPHDQHRITPFAMQRYLEENGFEEIRLQALGGWDASMLSCWAFGQISGRSALPGIDPGIRD
jgi:hypothetical protein